MKLLLNLFYTLCFLSATLTNAQNLEIEQAKEQRDVLLERLNSNNDAIRIDTIDYFGNLSYVLPIFEEAKFKDFIEFINMDFRYLIDNSDFYNFGNISSISIVYHPQVIIDVYFEKGIKCDIKDKSLSYLMQEKIKKIDVQIWSYKAKFYQDTFKIRP